MIDLKGFDKDKLPLLLLPIAGLFIVLFVFMGEETDANRAVKKEKDLSINYDLDGIKERKENTASRLELYRKNRGKSKINNSDIITDDDFYELEGDAHYTYEIDHGKDEAPTKDENEAEYNLDIDEPEIKVIPKKEVVKYVDVTQDSKSSKSVSSTKEAEQTVSKKSEPTKRTRSRNSLVNDKTAIEDNTNSNDVTPVLAFITNDNKLVKTGYDVNLLLSESMKIGDYLIPKNTIITGKASLSRDRVNISINTLYYNNTFIPVALEVYEPNGTKGVKVHTGANQEIKDDVQQEVLDQASATVNVPVVGSLTVGSAGKKKDEKGVVLIDRHKVIIK